MSFLSSWWSSTQHEEEKTSEETNSDEKPQEVEASTNPADWVSGLETSAFTVMRKVTSYATTLGETAQDTVKKISEASLLGDFQKEQQKFEREQRRQKDSSIPPWVGYNEEEKMKADILQLSADSRNVLREPPPGVQFHFDFDKSYPIAMAILKEDSRLQKLRFELVPKKISEKNFWCNYFYRVFLIKQSSQLATLSADTRSTAQDHPVEGEKVESAEAADRPRDLPQTEAFAGEVDVQSHPEEFASDAFHQVDGNINRESLKTELDQLGVTPPANTAATSSVEDSCWEEELREELKGLDLEGVEEEELPENKEGWEAELEHMLDLHSKDK